MKRLLLALSLLLVPLSASAALQLSVVHDLQITIDPATGSLSARDRLSLPQTSNNYLNLRLARQVEIRDVRQGSTACPWQFDRGILHIGPLPSQTPQLPIEITYRGTFVDPVPTAPLNTENPGYGVAAAITPAGTFLAGGAGWYPDPGEGPALFRVEVHTPPGIWAVTAGRLVKRTTNNRGNVIVWQTEHPLPGLTLAAGAYQIGETHLGSLPIYTFFTGEHAKFASLYLSHASNDMQLYQKLFGLYPFPKFAVVENFFPTGYGFPSWTLLGSSIVPLPFIVTTSLAHEISHSWWGNGVRVDPRYGNWCEGLATYVADYLLKEQNSPAAARDYRLETLRSYASLVPPAADYPLADFVSRATKIDQAIGYGKSAMVFHMARRRVGDAAFWDGLRQVARTKMFAEASWDDFARAFDPKGRHGMKAFFAQWVQRSGAPVLRLEDVASVSKPGEFVVTGRVVQQDPTFDLALPLRIAGDGETVDQVLQISGSSTPFRFSVPFAPSHLWADPEDEVFRRLAPEELPPTVNTLRGSEHLMVIASQNATPQLRQAAKDLLIGLGQKASWVEEKALSEDQRAGQDILLVGWPTNPALRPPLPALLQVSPQKFRIGPKAYQATGDVLFAVLPRDSQHHNVTGVFLGLGGSGAQPAARKIPHYGRYSYLVFVDGQNQEKGTWPVTASPLLFTWPKGSPLSP